MLASDSSGAETVTVMQTTKSWHGYDWATYIRVFLWFATRRCSLMILECLQSIRAHSSDYRLIVIDNGSPAF
jgi:hypothetical protein